MSKTEASRIVAGYILEPVQKWDEVPAEERERIATAAVIAYNNQPNHICYWNNRFCIATMCELDETSKRMAAWCMVSNGLIGYWEWFTHSNYPVHRVLHSLGIINLNHLDNEASAEKKMGLYWDIFKDNGYSRIHSHLLLRKIVDHFQLPTAYFIQRELSVSEQAERLAFNQRFQASAMGDTKKVARL